MRSKRVLRIGHRGAAGHAPENTLAAIHAGLSCGVDLIEIDVQRTSDGGLVLMHDKRVDRTTNGTGLLSQMSFAAVRQLDAGNGQLVPTLEEAMAAVNRRAGLMIEIITPGSAVEICQIARRQGFQGSILYASFLHSEIRSIRGFCPNACTLALLEGVPVSGPRFAHEADATHVGLAFESVTAEFVHALSLSGIRVFVYTVDKTADICTAIEMGADGIISDYPDRIN